MAIIMTFARQLGTSLPKCADKMRCERRPRSCRRLRLTQGRKLERARQQWPRQTKPRLDQVCA
eukprot:scaffold15207_cov38-Prasinocladus_malaysianus.AAC.2